MNFSEKVIKAFKNILPSPFTIAILLTLVTFILALILTIPEENSTGEYFLKLTNDWQNGLWDNGPGGIYFAFQMMLMLVLGHCLALTKPVKSLISALLYYCKDTASSALTVTLAAMLMSFFNWGLGLIFGAILARKIGEKFKASNQVLNYGLIGAGAYSGLMVWHGGLSGSAPTKVLEPGYLRAISKDQLNIDLTELPDTIPFESTIASGSNILISLACLIIIPVVFYFLGRKSKGTKAPFITLEKEETDAATSVTGIEKLDFAKWFGTLIGLGFISFSLYKMFSYSGNSSFGFLSPNFINFFLFGLCLCLHQSIVSFLKGIQSAIGDSSGILIQFPLYFGILGIMKGSGLITLFSDFFVEHASADSFPFFTFISAGIVNFFVPSGGGQWAIQGPILISSAQELGVGLPKTIMAMSYGDQLTNMLQPFWALPLLGITQLKAKDILPYTFILFLLGLLIFGVGIWLF